MRVHCFLFVVCSLALVSAAIGGVERRGISKGKRNARDETCGEDLKWSFEDGTLTISGSGDMMNYPSGCETPWNDFKSSIKSIVVEEGVTSIGDYAFSQCDDFDWYHSFSIELPSTLTRIGSYVFFGNGGLTEITIPESTVTIGEDAFGSCSSLASLDVEQGNEMYSSYGGVLFNRAYDTLIRYPSGNLNTTYEIPENITTIAASAFSYSSRLLDVFIPENVTTIGNSAFSSCSSLKTLSPFLTV